MSTPTQAAANLDALEAALQYQFQDASLLERALTHRSWAHEETGPGAEIEARRLHNEAMEFVGDSVLGMIIAEYLFQTHPALTEGELSRMKHRLVSASTLACAADTLGIGLYVRFGRGEENTGGRRKKALLADSFEAVLAAIYLDGGLSAATDFVYRTLGVELEELTPEGAAAADTKTVLQERLQAGGRNAPQYKVIETVGPPHRRTFRVEACWDGGSVCAEGRTIKTAEMQAAKRALLALDGGKAAADTVAETISNEEAPCAAV